MPPRHCLRTGTATLALFALLSVVALYGCPAGDASCTRSSDCPPGEICSEGRCVRGTDAGTDLGTDVEIDVGTDVSENVDTSSSDSPVVDGTPTCTEGQVCDGGVCRNGRCCPVSRVCGDSCCSAGEICFANACVTPGRACRTSADCDPGSYCEPSLGTGSMSDGGMPDGGVIDGSVGDAGRNDGGRVCSAPAPIPGRCLALPPRCPEGDAGVDAGPAGDGGCIARCEYRPPTGRLNAEIAWSWGQPRPPAQYPQHIDVWSTPAVGRIYDANCDGRVDALDPPNLVFVSGNSQGTCCQCTGSSPSACLTGVLRVLDGRTGADLLSVRAASRASIGFAGVSVAVGDLDSDGDMDIAAVTGEGYVVVIDRDGNVLRTSDRPIPGSNNASFGWGGGLAIADMDGDGAPEIAYGPTVYTTAGGGLRLRFSGTAGGGGENVATYLSTFADVDGAADGRLELVAGKVVYRADGSVLWNRTDLRDGFPAVADFDADGRPEVVLVSNGQVWILDGANGSTRLGPVTLPGMGFGGPPTVADFDGTPGPEIGVAQANYYTVLDPDFRMRQLRVLWRAPNHDLSSSVTGSTVFDFEGDGVAEVLYADECFVWVYDGPSGNVRFVGLTSSFTATEASLVADVDGDGHAEIVAVANGADPRGWRCNVAPWNAPDPVTGRPAWTPPMGASAYRGIWVYRDRARSWVGTRPMWNQHTYHVTNVCVPGDDACGPGAHEGQIPVRERPNWTLPWLNNFRQNVQQSGLFNAPDATVTLAVQCTHPPTLVASVRNLGEAPLPEGVVVGFFLLGDGGETMLGTARTTTALFPGGVQNLTLSAPSGTSTSATFVARILVDPMMPTFRECRSGNNSSAPARAVCGPG